MRKKKEETKKMRYFRLATMVAILGLATASLGQSILNDDDFNAKERSRALPGQVIIDAPGVGPIYPVTVNDDGTYTVHKDVKQPEPPRSLWDSIFESPAWAVGFDVPIATPSAYGYDGSICLSNGTYAGLTVPRCTNGDGKFYIAFGMPAAPASPPSFTMAMEINNSGGETTTSNNFCYRGSCAVVTAGGPANTIAALTFGTVSALASTAFTSPCNAANKNCTGAATAAFTCQDNGQAAGCAVTACNDKLTVIFVEPRKTSCSSPTTVSIDYGLMHLVEAN